jgi:hypothetical protein
LPGVASDSPKALKSSGVEKLPVNEIVDAPRPAAERNNVAATDKRRHKNNAMLEFTIFS